MLVKTLAAFLPVALLATTAFAGNGPCGGPDKIVCAKEGDCCSKYGFCGDPSMGNYCTPGCQPLFSNNSPCGSSPNPSPTSTRPNPGPTPTNAPGPKPTIITKCVKPGMFALTWDDGPDVNVPNIIRNLTAAGVPTSFFVNGKNHADLSDPNSWGAKLVKTMDQKGYTIGSHLWEHKRSADLSKDQLAQLLCKNDKALEKILGGVTPRLFRPPFLSLPADRLQWVTEWGYTTVNFNLNPEDWKVNDSDKILAVFKDKLTNGDPSKDSFISNTHSPMDVSANMLPTLLKADYLKKWKKVTVGECIGLPSRSQWYRPNPWGKNGFPSC